MANRKTLNIPKNPRKFNIWESDALNETLQKTHQLVYNIEDLSVKNDVDIHVMEDIKIPVHLLYEICEAYNILYSRLLKEQLLVTANLNSNNNLH
jgi:hypothetical protein